MNRSTTRRAALRAGAAAIGVLCAPALAMAAVPAVDLDADLYAALDRWEALNAEMPVAVAAFDAAATRAEAAYLPRPAALWSGNRDLGIHLRATATGQGKRPDGRTGCFFHPGDVERLRAGPPVKRWAVATTDTEKSRREPDPDGEARRQEIIAAHDEWYAARKAVEDAVGYTAAHDAIEANVRALNAAERAASLCPPRTMAGLARKAAWVADLLAREAGDDDLAGVFARQVAAFAGASA